MKKVIVCFLALAFLTVACKKSKDAPAYTTVNVAGVYMLDKVTYKSGSNPETDITSQFVQACQKDDVVTLKTDLTYTSHDAGLPCTGDFAGTWGIPSASTFKRDTTVYNLTKWDGSILALSQTGSYNGTQGTFTSYMKRQ